jgi:hypothetical protein
MCVGAPQGRLESVQLFSLKSGSNGGYHFSIIGPVFQVSTGRKNIANVVVYGLGHYNHVVVRVLKASMPQC